MSLIAKHAEQEGAPGRPTTDEVVNGVGGSSLIWRRVCQACCQLHVHGVSCQRPMPPQLHCLLQSGKKGGWALRLLDQVLLLLHLLVCVVQGVQQQQAAAADGTASERRHRRAASKDVDQQHGCAWRYDEFDAPAATLQGVCLVPGPHYANPEPACMSWDLAL